MTVPLPDHSSSITFGKKLTSTKRVLMAQADQSHKVMNAGQAMLFVVLTLMIGAILNSSALYTRAKASEPSFGRTVSMTLLTPFDRASRAIGLTSLRQETRSAMDLPRDDKIDTFTFDSSKTPPPVATTLPLLTETNRLSVWVVGDSLSITPGESIQTSFPSTRFNMLGVDGRVSTGMSRPDVFNWFTHISQIVTEVKPQLIIATFGANDDQSIYTDRGYVGPFGSEAWRKEYASRISSTLDFLAAQGTYTLWVEIPPVRDPVRNDRYKIINEITRTAVENHKNSASYVETKAAFSMPDGTYQDSIPVNGTLTLLRAQDGIHFTRAGGNVIADLVYKKLKTLYSF